MKTQRHIIISLFILFSFVRCTEDTLDAYDESFSGNSIYFSEPYNTALDEIPSTGTTLSFGFWTEDIQDTLIAIRVNATGPTVDHDRAYTVATDPTSTLEEGSHYEFVDSQFTIPAGQTHGFIYIRLLRSPDLQYEPLTVKFKLKDNENFNTRIRERVSPNKQVHVNILEYSITVDDIVGAPYAWSVTPYKTYLDNYLGEFSKVKLQLLVDLFDIDPEVFTDESYALDDYFTLELLTYWANYMKFWLDSEAAEGRGHRDEYGEVITMGAMAQ